MALIVIVRSAIQVNTYVQGQATVNFTASGGSLTLPLAAEFSLVNGTALVPGWTLLLSLSVPLSATAALSGTSVQITPSVCLTGCVCVCVCVCVCATNAQLTRLS